MGDPRPHGPSAVVRVLAATTPRMGARGRPFHGGCRAVHGGYDAVLVLERFQLDGPILARSNEVPSDDDGAVVLRCGRRLGGRGFRTRESGVSGGGGIIILLGFEEHIEFLAAS